MKHNQGFSLLEALLALAVAAFLLTTLTTLGHSLSRTTEKIYKKASSSIRDEKLLYLIQHDLTGILSYLPPQQTQQEKEKNDQKLFARTLIAKANEQQEMLVGKKKYYPLNVMTFVTTAPLDAGRDQARVIRVAYKMVKEKLDRPYHKISSYKLYRKETYNLNDVNLKAAEKFEDKDAAQSSEWILVAEHLNTLCFEFVTTSTTTEKEPPKPVRIAQWPNPKIKDAASIALPQWCQVLVRRWNDNFSATYNQELMIPFATYSGTLPDRQLKKKTSPPKPEAKKDGGKPGQPKVDALIPPAMGAGPQMPALPPLPAASSQEAMIAPHELDAMAQAFGMDHQQKQQFGAALKESEKILNSMSQAEQKQLAKEMGNAAEKMMKDPKMQKMLEGLFK